MKTQTRILDNRLYYTRKIALHRKGKKSRTVQITPVLICGIWWPPHLTSMGGARPFFGGSGRRVGAHTCPAFPKMPTTPSAFPSGGGRWTQPPEGGKILGEDPLRPKEISRYRDTLSQIRAADNTAGRRATRQLERCQTEIDLRYLLLAPPNGQVWHKAFLWWVRAQDRSPNAPGISQKCPQPRRHSPD